MAKEINNDFKNDYENSPVMKIGFVRNITAKKEKRHKKYSFWHSIK